MSDPTISDPTISDPATSDLTVPSPTGTPQYGGSSSTSQTAKDQASEVKESTKDAARNVAGTATDQARGVAAEVGQQSRQLLSQTSQEVSAQASTQKQRLSEGLDTQVSALRSMSQNADQSGLMTDLAGQLAERGEHVSGWLSSREPRELLDDVASFARRRPVAFLAIAAGAGVLVGRFSRGLIADAKGGDPALKANHRSDSVPSSPATPELSGSPAFTEPRRPMSMEEIPTSGSGDGPTFDSPQANPSGQSALSSLDPLSPMGSVERTGGIDR